MSNMSVIFLRLSQSHHLNTFKQCRRESIATKQEEKNETKEKLLKSDRIDGDLH